MNVLAILRADQNRLAPGPAALLRPGDRLLAELELSPQSSLPGQTLKQIDFRRRFGAVVLAIRRGGGVVRTNIEKLPLQRDDVLLV
ncbi:MAG: TrkA C-terminal domain-containing protein [Anaerolineales bacterium]|nr:MAG: TrkA C-terminal domain-containing protein [Anaerolineales bacterium]